MKTEYFSPWCIVDSVPDACIGYRAIVTNEGTLVCNPSPMGESNARLIAAAPVLLELLELALDDPDVEILGDDWVARARAAILQATGTHLCSECGEVQVSAHDQRCSFCDPGEGKVKT